MEKYLCECCGGHINPRTMTCEYCGTQYKRQWDDPLNVVRIETYRNPVKTFTATMAIDSEKLDWMGAKDASIIALNHLRAELSKALYETMVVESEHDIARHQEIIRGTVKIVVPEKGAKEWIKEREHE